MLSRIPAEKNERNRLRNLAQKYAKFHPPILLTELEEHATILCEQNNILEEYRAFLMVVLNNEAWKEYITHIPYKQRILFLPQCLRDKSTCPATMDELGLLCENCGQCILGSIVSKAEELGYSILIAEGTTIVTQMLRSGNMQAVFGVGCLESLQKAFPHWSKHGIPGIAIPLCRAGCNCTQVDEDWLQEMISHPYNPQHEYMSIQQIRKIVTTWFSNILPFSVDDPTAQKSYECLTESGKRWRPTLVALAYFAIACQPYDWEMIRKLGIAVECFHKASLVHDDIEDQDVMRDSQATMYGKYGLEIAINIGDFLVGEGYFWISNCKAAPDKIVAMQQIAIQGHQQLCMGQGQELFWRKDKKHTTISVDAMTKMFSQKTAPGFSVALCLGAVLANANVSVIASLQTFSIHLGIAYQILDDIRDFQTDSRKKTDNSLSIMDVIPDSNITLAYNLLEKHRNLALESLRNLQQQQLKVLLHQVLAKVLE